MYVPVPSQIACNSVCCYVTYLFFVHYFGHKLVRKFSRLNCFTYILCHFGAFYSWIYAIRALLIDEGSSVTYWCKFHCHLVACGELAIKPHPLIHIYIYRNTYVIVLVFFYIYTLLQSWPIRLEFGRKRVTLRNNVIW